MFRGRNNGEDPGQQQQQIQQPMADAMAMLNVLQKECKARSDYAPLEASEGFEVGKKFIKGLGAELRQRFLPVLQKRNSQNVYRDVGYPLVKDRDMLKKPPEALTAQDGSTSGTQHDDEELVRTPSGFGDVLSRSSQTPGSASSSSTETPQTRVLPRTSLYQSEYQTTRTDTTAAQEARTHRGHLGPGDIAAHREENERELNALGLYAAVQMEGFLCPILRRKLSAFLRVLDREMGQDEARPIGSAQGLYFGLVLKFLEGEMGSKAVLRHVTMELVKMEYRGTMEVREYTQRVEAARQTVLKKTGINLAQEHPLGRAHGDLLYDFVMEQFNVRERQFLSSKLGNDKRFGSLLTMVSGMTASEIKPLLDRQDISWAKKEGDERARQLVQAAMPSAALLSAKAAVRFLTKVGALAEGKQNKPATFNDKRKADEKIVRYQNVGDANNKQDVKKEVWEGDPPGHGRGVGGRSRRGRGRGRGRGDRGEDRNAGRTVTWKKDNDKSKGGQEAKEMDNFQVKISELPGELSSALFTAETENDQARTAYDAVQHAHSNAEDLATGTLKVKMQFETDGKPGQLTHSMGLDTQSEVSIVTREALANCKQIDKATAQGQMTGDVRRHARLLEAGINVRGIGGTTKMGEVAYVRLSFGGNSPVTLPVLVGSSDEVPKGTVGLLSLRAIQTLFTEQQFGKLAFYEEPTPSTIGAAREGRAETP